MTIIRDVRELIRQFRETVHGLVIAIRRRRRLAVHVPKDGEIELCVGQNLLINRRLRKALHQFATQIDRAAQQFLRFFTPVCRLIKHSQVLLDAGQFLLIG